MSGYHMGINLGHDRSVAIVRDGEIVVAIEQERLDRIKHSVGLMLQSPDDSRQVQVPGECIRYCLDAVGVPLDQMATITPNMPGDDKGAAIMKGKFSADIARQVREIPSHHLAHAYSAYWPSGFEDALVLVVDASGTTFTQPNGRWTESYSLYRAHAQGVELVHGERVLAHLAQLSTLGFLYEYITRATGFITVVGNGLEYAEAGKLMGLAPYGGPQPNLREWVRSTPGSLSLDIPAYDIFLEIAALEKRYGGVEGPRHHRPWLVDLAWKVQNELELAMKHLVAEGMAKTGLTHLCLAGGVALNSVANYRVLRDLPVDDIFVFPAAGDNGIAAGCALWAYATESTEKKRVKLKRATLGRAFSEQDIQAAIDRFRSGVIAERLSDADVVPTVSEALSKGRVVARFEGGSEYGPRALGHRSILADPTYERMKDVLNGRVKFREAYRPFAPVIPLERANDVFDLKTESPYMLLVADIHPEMHAVVPSITHRDGTGRVQTCTADANPFFHGVCLGLEKLRGGPPVLLNTSFNVAGQPIVESPEEAIRTFLKTDIDHLSIGNWWLRKQDTPVRDYEDHLYLVKESKMPAGVETEMPSVRPLMDSLDRALFGRGDDGSWASDDLKRLARIGARWRESSHLYEQSPYVAPLKTMLSEKVVLILDPINGATLADAINTELYSRLTEEQVEALLVLVSDDPQSYLPPLRLRLQRTHAELDVILAETASLLRRYGVAYSEVPDRTKPPKDPIESITETAQILGAFADEDLDDRVVLSAIRTHFNTVGYLESNLTALLNVESLQQIAPTELRYLDRWALPKTPLADLARLFLLRAAIPSDRARRALGESGFTWFSHHGLIEAQDGLVCGKVDIFCSGGLRFVTDHRYHLRAGDALAEEPVMYIGMDSHGLVQTVPRVQSQAVLDLCCGSGIQGIVASRYASTVTAVDINPRAVRFARFNAQFNGVENYRCVLGSLYTPVQGQCFDLILANPPFVPSPVSETRFRDGGAGGEEILAAIIEGSAEHLTQNGCVAIVTDLVNVPEYTPKLARWWQGDAASKLVLQTADRDEKLFTVPHVHRPFDQSLVEYEAAFDQWVQNFRDARLKAVNFGYIFIWQGEPEGTVIRTINNPSTPIFEQVNRWFKQRRQIGKPSESTLYLTLHPDVRFLESTRPDGSVDSVELTVPNNAFYTTYRVPTTVSEALKRIHRMKPRLCDRWNDGDSGWLLDLLEKNILLTMSDLAEHTVAASSPRAVEIDERPTKTTPTCLSSYLR